jgi:hypothetical protein
MYSHLQHLAIIQRITATKQQAEKLLSGSRRLSVLLKWSAKSLGTITLTENQHGNDCI